MATGHIQNYQGAQDGGSEWLVNGDNVFVKIYNGTAGALTNGEVYALVEVSSGALPYFTVLAPEAIATATARIVVVNNTPLGLGTIARYAWGYVQYRGLCPLVNTTTTVVENQQVEVLAAVATVQDQGTAGGTVEKGESIGVVVAVVTADTTAKVYLFGKQVTVEAA